MGAAAASTGTARATTTSSRAQEGGRPCAMLNTERSTPPARNLSRRRDPEMVDHPLQARRRTSAPRHRTAPHECGAFRSPLGVCTAIRDPGGTSSLHPSPWTRHRRHCLKPSSLLVPGPLLQTFDASRLRCCIRFPPWQHPLAAPPLHRRLPPPPPLSSPSCTHHALPPATCVQPPTCWPSRRRHGGARCGGGV